MHRRFQLQQQQPSNFYHNLGGPNNSMPVANLTETGLVFERVYDGFFDGFFACIHSQLLDPAYVWFFLQY
jgi:hypothetical protein